MGNALCAGRRFFKTLCAPSPVRILFLGLDAVGKTSSLYRLKCDRDFTKSVISTCGFNVETVYLEADNFDEVSFTVWDVGGGVKMPPLWKHYFPGTQGVVFIVDASDSSRRDEEKELFIDVLMKDDLLTGVPLLLLVNKQDIPGAATPSSVAAEFGLESISGERVIVRGASARTGVGLKEALLELYDIISLNRKKKCRQHEIG